MNSVILLGLGSGLLAPESAKSIWAISSGQELLWLMLSLVLIGLIGVGIIALNLLFILQKALVPKPVRVPVPQLINPRSLWQRVAGLHLLSQEKDLMMEHACDGIAELDNPTPPWFMGLFYGSIVAAIAYMIVFHVAGSGDIMGSEYTQEMAIADKQREAYIAKVAGGINENNVTQLVDVKGVGAGKVLYAQNCVACHGANAEGKVGPNLTDAFWLHGGSVNRISHTLTEGVPAKGMIAWKRQLNPLQIQQVASYLMSLQWVIQPMTRFLHSPTLRAFAGLGFLNGLLPCGFAYVTLTGAITTGSAATGAVYMVLFGLGTVPALLAVRFLPSLFPVALRRRVTLAMPIVMVGLAALLLVRGSIIRLSLTKPGA